MPPVDFKVKVTSHLHPGQDDSSWDFLVGDRQEELDVLSGKCHLPMIVIKYFVALKWVSPLKNAGRGRLPALIVCKKSISL